MVPFVSRTALVVLILLGLFAPAACKAQAQTLEDLLDGAQAAQQAGDYVVAADLFRRATVLSPNTAELWSNRGVMEYLAHQREAAASSLKHALRLNPNLFVSLLFLGKTSLDNGNPAEALPNLDRAHALQPSDPEVLLALGKANALLGRPGQAESSYIAVVTADPSNTAAWLGFGASALAIVTRDGRNLTSAAPQSIWARALYADELLAQGRPLEATDVYTAAIASSSPEQRAVLARTLQAMQQRPEQFLLPEVSRSALARLITALQPSLIGNEPPCTGLVRNPVDPVTSASCAYLAGDYIHSASTALLAEQRAPRNIEALYWSIKANERLAVAALSRVDELAPDSVTMHVLLGDLYREQHLPDVAAVEYGKALSIDAHDPDALLGLAAADLAANKLDDAAAAATTALAGRPLDSRLNLLMAEILGARGHETEARPYLARCGNIAPELQSRVHYLLGRAAAANGDLPEAIRQFQMALPGDVDGKIHFQLSRLYRKSGDVAKARVAEAEARSLVNTRDAKAAIVVREVTSPKPSPDQ